MTNFHFKLVTPERVVLEEELYSLTCETQMGQLTILPRHTPLISNLVPGELIARGEHSQSFLSLSGGVLTVEPGGSVTVLADVAEHVEELDIAAAEKAVKRSKIALEQETLSEMEYAKTAASLEHALSRLRIARKKHRGRKMRTGDFDNLPNE